MDPSMSAAGSLAQIRELAVTTDITSRIPTARCGRALPADDSVLTRS
jgi:hypothetical protein